MPVCMSHRRGHEHASENFRKIYMFMRPGLCLALQRIFGKDRSNFDRVMLMCLRGVYY